MIRNIDLFIDELMNPAGQLLNLFTCYGLIIISKDYLDRCTALYKLFKGIVYLFINESVFIIRWCCISEDYRIPFPNFKLLSEHIRFELSFYRKIDIFQLRFFGFGLQEQREKLRETMIFSSFHDIFCHFLYEFSTKRTKYIKFFLIIKRVKSWFFLFRVKSELKIVDQLFENKYPQIYLSDCRPWI